MLNSLSRGQALLSCALVVGVLAGCSDGGPPTAAMSARVYGIAPPSAAAVAPQAVAPQQGDSFNAVELSGWQSVAENPVSTFSLDVDTASYAYVRRLIRSGTLPVQDAVRPEQIINYFPYSYPAPSTQQDGFAITTTVTPSPWKAGAKLLHVAVKGWEVPQTRRPRANLTFLLDVSGSMWPQDRLPLIQKAVHLLGEGLRPDDTVSIVTYANNTKLALEPTSGVNSDKIMEVVDSLRAEGGTYGEGGLRLAYQQAEKNFDPTAINRVILATDGDFNVGETSPRALEQLIVSKRKTGIYLSVVGVGTGNLNDGLMQRLAHAGNGQAAYLDSLLEARKIWVQQMDAATVPIADDVKVQVEFNPLQVADYRLVGYETRMLKRPDFNDDKVDAGEVNSGHSITAIYEFLPTGAKEALTDPLRYGHEKEASAKTPGKASDKVKKGGQAQEIGFVKLRYKQPGEQVSKLITAPVSPKAVLPDLSAAPDDVRFSVAMAGYAQLLRGQLGPDLWSATIDLADTARGRDPYGWRSEAVQLMRAAQSLAASRK